MTDMPEVAMDVKGLGERLPVVNTFAINPRGGPDIVVDGACRFATEREVEALVRWSKEAATALTSLSRELAEARAERDAMQEAARGVTYISKQATDCAGCGARKHTPLKRDEMGGYVCLACVDSKLEAAEAALAEARAERAGALEAAGKLFEQLDAAEAALAEARAERDAECLNAGRYADESLALRGDIAAADALRAMWHDRALAAEAASASKDERIRELEAVLDLYRDAVRIDVKMEGPKFMGSNASALKQAWEADRARSTKEPT